MNGTAKEHDTEVKILESKLQSLSERIIGLSEAGNAAINTSDQDMTFECRLESNEKDLDNFDEVWDRLRVVKITAGKSFPDSKLKDLYDSVHNEVMSGKAIYKRIQRQIRSQGPLPIQPVDANATLANQSSAKAHLPKIPIPQFSGDPTKWSHFKDIYLSLVHNESALSNIEKYHYLLSALRGDALSLVSGLPIEDGSYMQAWEKLSKTYGNTRVLGSLLLQKIIDCDVRHAKNEAQRFEIFLTGVADNIQAFRALDLEDPKEFILSCLALRALDSDTRKQFELTMKPDAPHPKSEDVIGFVRQRKLALKMSQQICIGNATSANRQKYLNSRSPRYDGVALHSFTDYPVSHSGPQSPHAGIAGTSERESDRHKQHAYRCQQCSGNHRLSRCDIFLRLDSTKRFEAVKGWKTCWNCLTPGHTVKTCKSRFTCRKCKGKHHTLLHTEPKGQVSAPGKGQDVQSKRDKPTQSQPNSAFTGFGSSTDCSTIPSTVLLGTVRALVKGDRGDLHSVTAVLDSGSQQSFITYSLARKMGAIVSPFEGRIASLAEAAIPQSHLKGVTSCCIQPCDGSQQLKAHPVVVDRITSALPTRDLSPRIMDSLKHHPLADFEFSESGPIELLIGGDLYPRIITGGPSPAGIDDPHLTPSIFGLVVTGKLTGEPDPNTFTLFTESHMNIEEQLKAFWDMEEPTPVDRTHPEDALCEEHFCRTHSRTTEGRYVVRLPIKGELGGVGFNRDHVLKRYLTLKQKLKRNSTLLQKYSEFMQEYKDLQHMSRASGSSPYLIPHHGVWQESSIGPKLRVVFDASCPSSSSSLNEILMAGPKMQKDLCEILIRFRLYPIPICADLVKMYRQILVHKDDRHLQHILWRNNLANTISSCPPSEPYDLTTQFSSYISLVRTVAKILRWRPSNPSCVRVKFSDPISSEDFAEAENRVFAFVQRLEFPPALFSCQCPPSYASLSPFLDEHGILRVGGRLQNSSLNFSAKHPVLLPPKSRLARLIVEHIHRSNFHAGPSLTLSLLRNKYWIPRAPRLIRSCITQCVHCRLSKAKPICPLMASLPKERFNELRAFIQTGVDYAGPFLIKESTRRNAKISKAYLCLFVCLSCKALHLELVSSLSTSSFLATLERFMARRGAPSTIWSDHGTNFIGASRFIKDLYKFHQEIEADIIERLSPRGVEWKHIPPRAPHFGGIWEAGVKSVKGLLVNSIGKQASTFEELTTALCKIEALLNSRPLCQLTEDADNFDFLTPGHFLIGASPSSLPGPSTKYFKDIPPSSRWEITQAQIAHVWERWRKEYLHSLQQRKKWTHSVPGIQVGDLVILLERRSTVGVWPVGRVTKVFPGRDGVTRVVELRTPSGKTLTRAVSSVVPLFQPESQETTKKDSG